MKKIFACAAAALMVFLGGCANSGVKLSGGSAVVENAGVSVSLPDGWQTYTGKEIYAAIAAENGGDADEIKKSDESAGLRFLLLAKNADSTATVQITAQDITVSEDGEALADPMTAEEYARSCHDSALFDYFASGYRSGGDSVFEEQKIGENNGWHSFYEIFLPEENGGALLFGQNEYLFGKGNEVYSVQIAYISESGAADAAGVVVSAP